MREWPENADKKGCLCTLLFKKKGSSNMRKRITQEIIPGIVFFLLALGMWIITPSQVPTTEKSIFTARTFPHLGLGIVMICSAALAIIGVVHCFLEMNRNNEDKVRIQGNTVIFTEILVLVVAAVVLGIHIGLLVSGLLLTFGFLLIYGDRRPMHYVIVAGIVVVFYFLFKTAFGLNLP